MGMTTSSHIPHSLPLPVIFIMTQMLHNWYSITKQYINTHHQQLGLLDDNFLKNDNEKIILKLML
jgi:hypothetical protein